MNETQVPHDNDAPPRALAHAAAVVALYALAFTVFFSPVIFSAKLLAPGDGFNFHAPFFYFGRHLWTPLLWGGYPLDADPQTMAWYPPRALFSLLRSYNAFVVSAYALAASTSYAYAHALTRSRFASLVAGLTYGMSGCLVAQVGHVSLVHTAAFAPAIFWSLENLRRRASALWFAACAASVACAGLAGHFQIFTYALGVALLYVFVLGWAQGATTRQKIARLALMLSALALGVAATAVQLVPTFELTGQGQRAAMSFAEFDSFALPLRHLARLFFPYALGGSPGSFYAVPYFGEWAPPSGGWGQTELAIYVGVLPLMLAFVGVVAHRRNRVVWFWVAVAALSLLLAAGDATPLARLAFRLPAYNKFRVPARHLFEFALAVSTLAALGAHAIQRRLADSRRITATQPAAASQADDARARRTTARLTRNAIFVGFAALAISLISLVATSSRIRAEAARAGVANYSLAPWRNPATLAPLFVFAVAASALLFWARRPETRARQALLAAVLICDLASFGWFYEWRYVSPDARQLAPPAEAARYGEQLRAADQRALPSRGVLTPRAGSPPNASALWKVPSASGYSALILARTSRLLDMANDGSLTAPWQGATDRSLDLFAVRYLFAPREDDNARDGISDSETFKQLDPRDANAGAVLRDAPALGITLGAGCDTPRPDAAEFSLPRAARADSIALVTALACSTDIADDAPVLRVTATDGAGASRSVALRAGADSSEWAHDCADVLPRVRHRRAPVFESFTVARGALGCEGHSYLARLRFDRPLEVKNLRLEWIGGRGSADVKRIALIDAACASARLVRQQDLAPDPARWRRVEDAGGVAGYENLRARPRAWLVGEVLSLGADDALSAIKTGRLADGRPFDPARTAVVEEPSPLAGAALAREEAATASNGEAAITGADDTALNLRVRTPRDALLVTSDVYYPGWRARVDGREAHVYRTDYALRGVLVPAGEHAVEFSYEPRSLRVGALVSALALVAIVLVSLWLARRLRKAGGREGIY
ncbi:MAG: YfhO family protein [Pyrinomonadaceae bacterium]